MTASQIEGMGPWLVDLLSGSQLEAAAARYNANTSLNQQFLVPMTLLRTTWNNHFHRCMRMPAGGAQAGGSMQTGFEMEMLTAAAVHELMAGWPNPQEVRGGLSWEARTMEEAGSLLDFAAAGWGALNGKPIPPLPTTVEHRGILMASPPVTVCWQTRSDKSTCLTVRFPLTIWTEDNMIVLPPDDKDKIPFYLDPPGHPGFVRDKFKAWAHKILGELRALDYELTKPARDHLPQEYQSCDSSCVEEEDTRSVSAEVEADPDSSDEEGAHLPLQHRVAPMLDSSDEEGAHRPPRRQRRRGGGGGGPRNRSR